MGRKLFVALVLALAATVVTQLWKSPPSQLTFEPRIGNRVFSLHSNSLPVQTHPPVTVTLPVSVPMNRSKVMAAGGGHSLVLKADGTVAAWGDNKEGQLGDGTRVRRLTPVAVSGLTDVVALAAGSSHSLALRADGTVWSWGSNEKQQLGRQGDGTVPARVPGLGRVVDIAAGGDHSLALLVDGTVWAWGDNRLNQAGPGGQSPWSQGVDPRPLSELSGMVGIAAGDEFSLGYTMDGYIRVWGDPLLLPAGERGLSPPALDRTEVTPGPPAGVQGATAGLQHAMLLGTDGTVWAWGQNPMGEAGQGGVTWVLNPLRVAGLTKVSAIASGSNVSVALRADGTVWAWGDNDAGQLGSGRLWNAPQPMPTQVKGVKGAVAIAMGSAHGLALAADGRIWGWGATSVGQLGREGDRQYVTQAEVITQIDTPRLPAPPLPDPFPQGPPPVSGRVEVKGYGECDVTVLAERGGGHTLYLRGEMVCDQIYEGASFWWVVNGTPISRATTPCPIWNPHLTADGRYGCSTLPVEVVGPSGDLQLDIHASVVATKHGVGESFIPEGRFFHRWLISLD